MKAYMALILTLVLLITTGSVTAEEKATEGMVSTTSVYHGTFEAIAMPKESVQLNYKIWGVEISDTGEGLLHNSTYHCLGSFYAVKGIYKNDFGLCEYTLSDGNKLYMTYDGAGEFGKPSAKGSWTIIGGAGEYQGITGGGESERFSLRPAAEGTFQGYSKPKGSWKLP